MINRNQFEIESFNIIREDYFDDDPDDFMIYLHCDISEAGKPGAETFTVTVVSPKRLLRNASRPELGHGLVICEKYCEEQLRKLICPLIWNVESWEELTEIIVRYFDWI